MGVEEGQVGVDDCQVGVEEKRARWVLKRRGPGGC